VINALQKQVSESGGSCLEDIFGLGKRGACIHRWLLQDWF